MANTLLHSPAEVLRQLLIDLGLGTDPDSNAAWPVFASNEPKSPDNCITVYDTLGTRYPSQRRTSLPKGKAGFQVRIRAKDHTTGWQKADAIQKGLEEDVYQDTIGIGTSRYFIHAVVNMGDVLPLGTAAPDDRRSLFTLNAQAPLRQVS